MEFPKFIINIEKETSLEQGQLGNMNKVLVALDEPFNNFFFLIFPAETRSEVLFKFRRFIIQQITNR